MNPATTCALNRATADFLISSPLLATDDERDVPVYDDCDLDEMYYEVTGAAGVTERNRAIA